MKNSNMLNAINPDDYTGAVILNGGYINTIKARAAELRYRAKFDDGYNISLDWVIDVIDLLTELEEV